MLTECHRFSVAAIVGLLIAMCSPALSAQDLHGWGLDSTVKSVQLVGVQQSGALARFYLKNVSDKPITAIVAITPDGVRVTVEYFGEGELMPGAVQRLHAGSSRFPADSRVLHIAAVVFADGSSEGLRPQIDVVRANRLGRAHEAGRVKAIFAAPPAEQRVGDPDVEALIRKVGRLPASFEEAVFSVREVHLPSGSPDDLRAADNDVRFGFLAGVHAAREDALRSLRRLRQLPAATESASMAGAGTPSRAAFLSSLRQQYGQLSARHETLLKAMQREAR